MSTSPDNNDNEKKQTIKKLQEIVIINEDLKVISNLESHDKLWIGKKELPVKQVDNPNADVMRNCLEVHKASLWVYDAVIRTYSGQGREHIIAYISNIVDTLEHQSEYDFMKTKSFIPQYVAKINEAADKIESVIQNQYETHADEIESYVTRMRKAAAKILNVHSS